MAKMECFAFFNIKDLESFKTWLAQFTFDQFFQVKAKQKLHKKCSAYSPLVVTKYK